MHFTLKAIKACNYILVSSAETDPFDESTVVQLQHPALMIPCSMRPVATVPRPWMLNTSSTGMANGFSSMRVGARTQGPTPLHSHTSQLHLKHPFRGVSSLKPYPTHPARKCQGELRSGLVLGPAGMWSSHACISSMMAFFPISSAG